MWVIVSLDLSGEPGMRRVLAQGAASFTWKIPSHLKVISTLKVMFFFLFCPQSAAYSFAVVTSVAVV